MLEKTNRWVPTLGRPDRARLADAARRADQARARRRPRQGARQAGHLHQAALDLLPRGRQRRGLHGLQHARGRRATPRRFQRAASKIGYTFNWFYADAEHIAYFNSGANPVRAEGVNHDFPVGGQVRVAGLEPGHLAGALHAVHPAPAGGRPALLRQLEQQAGARLPLGRRQRLLLDLPLGAARGPREGGDRGREEADAAEADRRDGGGRDRRPARARRPAAGAAGARQADRPGAARRGRQAARLARGRRPAARRRTATASTSTATRSGSWTPGGRCGSRRSSSPCSARRSTR